MQIEFFTDTFRRSHGKLPRGYGCWAFQFRADCDVTYSEPVIIAPSCLLRDAKQKMKAVIRERAPAGFKGCVYVEVCP